MKEQASEGIFFLLSFDKIKTGKSIPYKKMIMEHIPNFDKDRDYIFYQKSNTALSFSNWEKHENIYYGIFEDEKLVKILQLDRECLKDAFQKKHEAGRNADRYNIPKDANGLEYKTIYRQPLQE